MNQDHDPKQFITPRILHDGPLRDAAEDAKFKFDQYAVTLARLIADKKTKTPFTIGISGAWGTGKTTLLHRIRAKLDETKVLLHPAEPALLSFLNPGESPSDYRVCRTVWFNAWKYADEDKLLIALIRVIVQAMADDSVVSNVIGKLLDPSYPRRDVIKTVLGWFSIKLPMMEIKLDTGDPQPTPFAEQTALLDLFDDAFDRLLAAWVHHKLDIDAVDPEQGVLVVFIDDLDRCLPPKMIQVLEAVKLFMDRRGCVFVLGADSSIIQQAVEKQYETAGVKGQTAVDYLEKVVQLRFNLPPIADTDMDSFVCSQVADDVLKKHWRIVTLGAESNPRKVKTTLNDLQLQWAVWRNTRQAGGIDFDDFVRWEVLMRTAPSFRKRMYTQIYDSPTRADVLWRAFDWAKTGNEEIVAGFRNDLTDTIRRVLLDIQEYKPHFTADLIERLIYLTARTPAVEPMKIYLKEPVYVGMETIKAVGQDKKLTPGGQEIFEFGGIQFVRIHKGEFLMGSTEENREAFWDERPQFKLNIPYDYWMGRFPVTNAQYAAFAGEDFEIPEGKADHPVVNVSWQDTQKFIAWLNENHAEGLPEGYSFQLPSESEWEKAARGEFGSEYPWGNEFDNARCNTNQSGKGNTTPVGAYSPQGDSPYGCADMAGNVWEWTRSMYQPYPYNPKDGREDLDAEGERVLRGGSFILNPRNARCACRYRHGPISLYHDLGFRVGVVSPISTSDL